MLDSLPDIRTEKADPSERRGGEGRAVARESGSRKNWALSNDSVF